MQGHIRFGGIFGEGAAVDQDYGSIDACVVLPTDRYQRQPGKECVAPAISWPD